MDFLNKALAQVTDLVRSMTPGARITATLLLVIVVVSVGYLFTYHTSGPDVYLLNGERFRPSDQNAMEAAFAKAGLKTYEWDGGRVRIPRGQQNLYVNALAEGNALPENYREITDNVAKNFSNPLLPPRQQEQIARDGKRRMLEANLREMKGVQNASVFYDAEKTGGFNQPTLRTASVNVTMLGGEQITESQVRAIRTLVANSYAGLVADNIGVTDLSNGRAYPGGGADGVGNASDDPYIQRQQFYQQKYRDDILRALSYVPGVTVVASVELDRQKNTHKETTQHDPKSVALEINEKTRTSTTEGSAGGAGGRPGFSAQQPNAALTLGASSQSKGSRQEQEESETRTTNVISKTLETTETVGLTPTRVTAVISVPTSYFQKVWREQNPSEPGAAAKTPDKTALDQIATVETKKIQECASRLLPAVKGQANLDDLVKVSVFQDITPPEMPVPGMGENAMGWFAQHWSTVGMIGLALFGLMMLRSLVRSLPAAAAKEFSGEPPRAAARNEEDNVDASPAAPTAAPRLRRFGGTGPSLRDELSEMVQEDPDAAANVLRAWIGSAGNKA